VDRGPSERRPGSEEDHLSEKELKLSNCTPFWSNTDSGDVESLVLDTDNCEREQKE